MARDLVPDSLKATLADGLSHIFCRLEVKKGGPRPGTSILPAIVKFGEAWRLANHNITTDMARQQKLTKTFIENTRVHFPECIVYAQSARRLPGTISIAFPGIPGDVLIANCPDYCFSRGLSCSAGPVGPAHVLKQM